MAEEDKFIAAIFGLVLAGLVCVGVERHIQAKKQRTSIDAMFTQAIDTNNDGVISTEETQAAVDYLKGMYSRLYNRPPASWHRQRNPDSTEFDLNDKVHYLIEHGYHPNASMFALFD